MVWKKLVMWLALLTAVAVVTVIAVAGRAQETRVIIGGDVFDAEIAESPRELRVGLGGRDRLPEGTGMLFLPPGGAGDFWMRGMRFDLDFVWIGANCYVVDLTERVAAPEAGAALFALERISSARPATYVFEINAGEIEARDIRLGERVVFEGVDWICAE